MPPSVHHTSGAGRRGTRSTGLLGVFYARPACTISHVIQMRQIHEKAPKRKGNIILVLGSRAWHTQPILPAFTLPALAPSRGLRRRSLVPAAVRGGMSRCPGLAGYASHGSPVKVRLGVCGDGRAQPRRSVARGHAHPRLAEHRGAASSDEHPPRAPNDASEKAAR